MSVKLVLTSHHVDVNETGVSGMITFFVDGISIESGVAGYLQGLATTNNAISEIGLQVGQPLSALIPGNYQGLNTTFMPRVKHISAHCGETGNAKTWFVDVEIGSAPAYSVQYGSSLIQQRNNLYIVETDFTSNPNIAKITKQAQITLPYQSVSPLNPTKILTIGGQQVPKITKGGSTTRQIFSKAVRVGLTCYVTKASEFPLNLAGTINRLPWGGEVARTWLCTGVNTYTENGGMSYRLSYDFVFNWQPGGWDPLCVVTDGGDPVLLLPDDAAAVANSFCSTGANGTATPLVKNGVGRFPIYATSVFGKYVDTSVITGDFKTSSPSESQQLFGGFN